MSWNITGAEFDNLRIPLMDSYNAQALAHVGYIIAFIIGVMPLLAKIDFKNFYDWSKIKRVIIYSFFGTVLSLIIYFSYRTVFWFWMGSEVLFVTIPDAASMNTPTATAGIQSWLLQYFANNAKSSSHIIATFFSNIGIIFSVILLTSVFLGIAWLIDFLLRKRKGKVETTSDNNGSNIAVKEPTKQSNTQGLLEKRFSRVQDRERIKETEVSRNEEIRAIFIFGLLAIFAYVKSQYPTLMLVYPNGSFDLIPIINILIILWSLYAFFMVLGLSTDSLGKSASIFRDISTAFLQYSYFVLGLFVFLFGFTIYGSRFFLTLLLIVAIFAISIVLYLDGRPKRENKLLSFNLSDLKKYKLQILGFIFLFASTMMVYFPLYYPESFLASWLSSFIMFVIAVISVTLILIIQKLKEEKKSKTDSQLKVSNK